LAQPPSVIKPVDNGSIAKQSDRWSYQPFVAIDHVVVLESLNREQTSRLLNRPDGHGRTKIDADAEVTSVHGRHPATRSSFVSRRLGESELANASQSQVRFSAGFDRSLMCRAASCGVSRKRANCGRKNAVKDLISFA
jgi:hypothetical protein